MLLVTVYFHAIEEMHNTYHQMNDPNDFGEHKFRGLLPPGLNITFFFFPHNHIFQKFTFFNDSLLTAIELYLLK